MKATFRTILCAAAAVLAAVSCQKSAEVEDPIAEEKGTIDIRIGGLMGEYSQAEGTKSSLVNTVRVSWENNDVVYVYDGTRCLGSLTATLENNEDRYALLSGTIDAPEAGTMLTLVHSPLLGAAPAVSEGAISISLAEQDGAKAPFVVYATLEYENETDIINAVVPFKFATSVIKVNCTGLKASTAIDHASLSNVNTVCKLTLSGTADPNVEGAETGIIIKRGDSSFAAEKVNAEGEAVFQIAVPALASASEARILRVVQNSSVFRDKKFTSSTLNPSTSVNTVCQMSALPADAISGEFRVSDIRIVNFSKGNLQAKYTGSNYTWNFAANQYDYIGKAAGNNTLNNQTSGKVVDLFCFSTPATNYGIHNSSSASAYPGVFVDWGKNFGDGNTWRTLSNDEWVYLFNTRSVNGGTGKDKSYSLNITYGGKMGLVLYPDDYTGSVLSGTVTTLPEGVVFLPAAGYRSALLVVDVGVSGRYWSSTEVDGDDTKAYCVRFLDNTVYSVTFSSSRSNGSSVRLITE